MDPVLSDAGLEVFDEPFSQEELDAAACALRSATRLDLGKTEKDAILNRIGFNPGGGRVPGRGSRGRLVSCITMPQAAALGSIFGLALALTSLTRMIIRDGDSTGPRR